MNRRWLSLVGPMAVAGLLAVASRLFSDSAQLQIQTTLVVTAMVVGLSVFCGNSGIISFGHVSFVAVGAFAAGILSMPADQKGRVFKELFPVLRDNSLGNLPTLLIGALVGGVFAAVVGAALVRLNGLAAGIATFAVLGITRNVLRNWTKIGPGAKAIPSIEQSTGLLQALVGLCVCIAVAWWHQQSRSGRRLRATREDSAAAQGVGISAYRERWIAFVISGSLSGFTGAVYVHLLGSVTADQVYIKLTFLTLAMLVIGGFQSLWGAVLGGLSIGLVNAILFEGEKGLPLPGWKPTLPTGTSDIVLAALMVVALLLRPSGLSSNREFASPAAN